MIGYISVVLLFIAPVLGGYPKARVLYVDPTTYDREIKCCMGVFNTPTKFNGRYQIKSFIVSSHVHNSTSGEQGVYNQKINVTLISGYGEESRDVARGTFTGTAGSTEPVDVVMTSVSGGGPFIVEPDQDYLIAVWYGGDLTYPMYYAYDLSVGPILSTQTLFTIGIDYEKA